MHTGRGRQGALVRDRGRDAFTLIEVLVVVAIIALLVAVLLPSLRQAKEQAKIATDMVNMKQVSTTTAEYQSECRGYVPVMFNYYANGDPNHRAPARACWLSVALAKYSKATDQLKLRTNGEFDPELRWGGTLRDRYEDTIMPEHFICPFQRDKGEGRTYVGENSQFRYYEWLGRCESYQTWLWEDIDRGDVGLGGQNWPGGPGATQRGIPKHTVFSWNKVCAGGAAQRIPGCESAGTETDDPSKRMYRQWTLADVRRKNSGSMSDTAVLFCAQGEHMLFANDQKITRANVGSHRRAQGGGTLAAFADSHVEWVVGTRIGWP